MFDRRVGRAEQEKTDAFAFGTTHGGAILEKNSSGKRGRRSKQSLFIEMGDTRRG